MKTDLIRAHLENAETHLSFAKSEPGHSPTEDLLIDAIDFLIGAVEELLPEES